MRKRAIAGLGICTLLAVGGCAAKQYFQGREQQMSAAYGIPALERSVQALTPDESVLNPGALPNVALPHSPALWTMKTSLTAARRAERHDNAYRNILEKKQYADNIQTAGESGIAAIAILAAGIAYQQRKKGR